MQLSTHQKAVILLLFCTFFWGSSFPVGKLVLTEINPLTLVFWRFIIASVLIGLYLKLMSIEIPTLSLRQWSWAIVVSIIGVGGLNLCLFTGLTYTSATNGSLIMSMNPIVTSVLGALVARKLLTKEQVFSLLVCLFGVLLVISKGSVTQILNFDFNHGDRVIILGMLCWSFYTYFTQGISRYMSVMVFTFVGMVSGVVVISLMVLLKQTVHPIADLLASSAPVLWGVLYIGVLATVGGYLLWLSGVKMLGGANAALFFNFVPIFAAISALGMGQSVTLIQWIGMGIVILGLLMPHGMKLLFSRRTYAKAMTSRS